MNRRSFLRYGLGAAVCGNSLGAAELWRLARSQRREDDFEARPPAYAIVPVVGDGTWIWTKPPDGETGYLEPRAFDFSVGIEMEGTGDATGISATTPVPVALPEQKIDDVQIETQDTVAQLRLLAPAAGQLMLAAPGISRGQIIRATARFRLTLYKQYFGYDQQQFPLEQTVPKAVRAALYDSPGIQVRDKEVRKLAAKIASQWDHPWDKARAFYEWVWEHIQARMGNYTSVLTALRDRVGDCEERAAVFVAFCRASGIPARLVWVPNHNWAEFYLQDQSGKGHWIPVHTSAYSWFGWTGAHELVLQKGDNITVPEQRKSCRLMYDWMRSVGSRPKVRYWAELKPVAAESIADAGPGARNKSPRGEWLLTGRDLLDKHVRR